VTPTKDHTFSALLQHRNGPYGYPVFKQIRTGEHRVAKNLRYNNYISVDKGFKLSSAVYRGTPRRFFPITQQLIGTELGTELYKEPAVELNSLPLIFTIKDINLPNEENIIKLKISYENLIKNFSNNNLNDILYLPKFNNEITIYDTILRLQNLDNARYVIENLQYQTVIFPNPQNITFENNRERTTYSFNWNDTREARRRTNVASIF
jgi:hypothetical protein